MQNVEQVKERREDERRGQGWTWELGVRRARQMWGGCE